MKHQTYQTKVSFWCFSPVLTETLPTITDVSIHKNYIVFISFYQKLRSRVSTYAWCFEELRKVFLHNESKNHSKANKTSENKFEKLCLDLPLDVISDSWIYKLWNYITVLFFYEISIVITQVHWELYDNILH